MLAWWLSAPVSATDYYLSGSGDDGNTGLSESSAWKTLGRVDGVDLEPGDRLLLEGGTRFMGTLRFDADDRGTDHDPIIVTSYGSGRATIDAGRASGLSAHNTAGISLSHVDFAGAGPFDNEADGIVFYTDLPGDVKLSAIRLTQIDVGGFGKAGIAIGGWNGYSGFRDIAISHALVHDNGVAGVVTYAQQPGAHKQVRVEGVRAFRNAGLPSVEPSSGSGIVLGGVSDGTIERSVAHDNGRLGNAGIGIWTYASTRILIQYNESFNNHTAGPADGGGFDLDGGVTDSVVQYNYSHDNDGAGYLLCQYADAAPWSGNTVRHNISVNDGRKNGFGGIHIWDGGPGLADADIHHNVVVIGPASDGTPSALRFVSRTRRFVVHHNTFVATGGARVMTIAPEQEDLRFVSNHCWSLATQPASDALPHIHTPDHADDLCVEPNMP